MQPYKIIFVIITEFNTKVLDEYKVDIHRDLIEQCKNGSRKAQFELYKLYSKAMLNISYRMLRNKQEAEDVLQEAFVEVFRRLDTFRFESTFGAWLKRIVVNRSINAINRKKEQLTFIEDMPGFNVTDDREEYDENEIKMNVQQVMKAMEQLPEGGRIVFSLYLLEGYDHEEISQILNISESTSKTQYMRAKIKIKEIIKAIKTQ